MRISQNIAAALVQTDPQYTEFYKNNLKYLIKKIRELDAFLKHTFKGLHGMPFMVFHPSWGYFAGTYGLRQIPIELEGKEPKPAELADLIGFARAQGIRVVFVQPQFSLKSARLIAREIGARVVVVDPLALNWDSNLREAARKIREAIKNDG
jgi:zinc transport system substrate-binding protein